MPRVPFGKDPETGRTFVAQRTAGARRYVPLTIPSFALIGVRIRRCGTIASVLQRVEGIIGESGRAAPASACSQHGQTLFRCGVYRKETEGVGALAAVSPEERNETAGRDVRAAKELHSSSASAFRECPLVRRFAGVAPSYCGV